MGAREVIITCEHAGNYVPVEFKSLFTENEDVLNTHRGWDPGALNLAKPLAKSYGTKLHFCKISRLLVEVNRSLHHEQLFSEFSKKLPAEKKLELIDKYYKPYRNSVESKIADYVNMGGAVVHLSMHTFTPILNGVERQVDIGLLFDESRKEEFDFSSYWKRELQQALPDLTIMFNCPYQGSDDGFTTYLRSKYNSARYLGIEIEVNQRLIDTPIFKEISRAFINTLPQGQVC